MEITLVNTSMTRKQSLENAKALRKKYPGLIMGHRKFKKFIDEE